MKTLNYSFRYLANRRGNTLARFVSLSLGLFVALIIFAKVGYNYSMNRWIPNHKQVYCVGQYSGVDQIVLGIAQLLQQRKGALETGLAAHPADIVDICESFIVIHSNYLFLYSNDQLD